MHSAFEFEKFTPQINYACVVAKLTLVVHSIVFIRMNNIWAFRKQNFVQGFFYKIVIEFSDIEEKRLGTKLDLSDNKDSCPKL